MVEVLIPWMGGDRNRQRALEWLLSRLTYRHPRFRSRVCEVDPPWCKARAIERQLRESTADVVLVHDADVWTDDLEAAVMAVTAGAASWAIPHRKVRRLTDQATAKVLKQRNGDRVAEILPTARDPYVGLEGGGIVVAQPATLIDVPLDPRYIGWGHEDASWGFALRLLEGTPWRSRTASLTHLWHPAPPEKRGEAQGSRASERLYREYLVTFHQRDREGMARLIEQAKAHPSATPATPA